MSYTLVDDGFHSNPKVLAAGLDGAGLYARALSYCGAYLTDGFVPTEWVRQATGGRRTPALKCATAGLWRPVEGGYMIPDYLEFNPSRAEVLARREERSRSGKEGARKRWQTDSKSNGSSHSSSHEVATGVATNVGDGESMARAPAAPAPSPTPVVSRADAAAEERSFTSKTEPSENSAAAPEAPPTLATVLRAIATLPGSDPNTIRQIEPLALQIPAERFRNAVRKVKRRRNVDNPCGLLVTLLRAEVKEHVASLPKAVDTRQHFQASCDECGWTSEPSPFEHTVSELAELHVCPKGAAA